jgi:NAD(P)-dependent dehydrogenase (short-subunit alcohol dehydrogenase family)
MPSVLITGTSRGLGLEFVRQYAEEGWDIHACARKPSAELMELAKKHATIFVHELEVTDHAAVDALAAKLKDIPLDLLINNAGVYGSAERNSPDQSLAGMNYHSWRETFEVNTIAPYKLTQAFIPCLARTEGKVVLLTTGAASLSAMKESGRTTTIYQTTKTALNMAGICLANELKPKNITVLLLHPGWARTDMGGPSAPLSVEDSITSLRKVIASSGLRESATYRDYSGQKLPW